jgi:uncharacterized membrane protein
MLKVQGVFTLVLIGLREPVSAVLGFGAVQSAVFQVSLIAVFLLVFFLGLLTVLYYLDKRRQAMYCCLLFAFSNALFTGMGILGGDRWFGTGFLLACGLSVLVSAIYVNRFLKNVDYDTFTSQPLYG